MSWILVTEREKETQPGLRALLSGTETGSDGTKYCEYICHLKFDSAEHGVSLAALCLESLVQWFLYQSSVEHSWAVFTERFQINRNFYWPIALSRIFKAIKEVVFFSLRCCHAPEEFSNGAGVRIVAHFAWR